MYQNKLIHSFKVVCCWEQVMWFVLDKNSGHCALTSQQVILVIWAITEAVRKAQTKASCSMQCVHFLYGLYANDKTCMATMTWRANEKQENNCDANAVCGNNNHSFLHHMLIHAYMSVFMSVWASALSNTTDPLNAALQLSGVLQREAWGLCSPLQRTDCLFVLMSLLTYWHVLQDGLVSATDYGSKLKHNYKQTSRCVCCTSSWAIISGTDRETSWRKV